MKILQMTLKKQWFDMIASGEKKEEYRVIKEHWRSRLEVGRLHTGHLRFKQFDIVRFRNGYSPDSPTMDVECLGIRFDYSKPEWCGGEYEWVYVISLGDVLNIENVSDHQP